jgi:uncharacterized paraquat-inducible protein A
MLIASRLRLNEVTMTAQSAFIVFVLIPVIFAIVILFLSFKSTPTTFPYEEEYREKYPKEDLREKEKHDRAA